MQVASFSDKNQALNLVRRLQDSGYPAYTLMVDVRGAGRRYRVRVGPYAHLDAAQGAAGRIRLQHKLAAYVTRPGLILLALSMESCPSPARCGTITPYTICHLLSG